jgi:hypothetical protein
MDRNIKRKELVGNVTIKGKHRLSIEALIEYKGKEYPIDVVFVTIDVDMGGNKLIIMQLDTNDLYDLIHAAKELFKKGEDTLSLHSAAPNKNTRYRKYTKSTKFSSILFFGIKFTEIKKKNENTPVSYEANYFINIRRDEKTYSVGFNFYTLQSFIDRITLLSKQLDLALFEAQAKVVQRQEAIRLETISGGAH